MAPQEAGSDWEVKELGGGWREGVSTDSQTRIGSGTEAALKGLKARRFSTIKDTSVPINLEISSLNKYK